MSRAEVGGRSRGGFWSGVVAVLVALVGALLLGGATSYLQTVLPAALSSFANSAGGWTMLAFLLVLLTRARVVLGAVLGVVAFEALVEGYGLVSGWRGYFYQVPFTGVYNLIGLLAGPVVGATASVTRHHVGPWRALAVAPLCAVLLGEGVFGLTRIADTTSPVYWVIELVLGVGFFVLGAVRSTARRRSVALSAAITLFGSVAFWLVFARL